MRLVRSLMVAIAFAVGAAAAGTAESPGEKEAWVPLESESLPAEWEEFRRELTSRRWAVSDFVEKRYFSFRNRPVELMGTVWFGREEGLTLAYQKPRREIVRVEANGVRVIRDDGRSRSRPIPERGRDVPAALLALFRFDFPEIEKTFAVEGLRDGREWSMRLVPREKERAPIQRILLGGHGDGLNRILIEQAGGRRIELELSNPAYPPDLGPEELSLLFP